MQTLSPVAPATLPMRERRRLKLPNIKLSLGIILLGLCFLAALIGPLLWRLGPLEMDFINPMAAPSWAHPMGTDSNGRDLFARFLSGAQLSLLVAVAVVIVGFLVGGGLGVLAGIGGRWTDTVIMRIIDSLAAFPPLILAMAVTVGLGVGITTAAIGISLSCVPFFARLMRSDVVRIRSLPFIEASVAIGAPRIRIILRHLLPHTASTMLVQCAAVFGYAILTLAGLGFIGLGAQIPTPEWGAMITDGMQYALTGQWWLSLFPGVGVFVAVIGANLTADGLQDMLDPRKSGDR